MINENNLQEFNTLISSPKTIALIPHRNPDGDAIGSTLGLCLILKALGHQAFVISPNDFPNFLQWMPYSNEIIVYEHNKEKAVKLLHSADAVFALDFNILARTGDEFEQVLNALKAPFVMIDHHQMPGDFAKITFSDTSFGSTCELVYTIIDKLGYTDHISKDAATCLYTGIVTDSGSFRFPKTTANTHRAVASLIEKGINNPYIHNALFDNNSYNRLQLMGRALERIVVMSDKKSSYLHLNHHDLNEFQHQKGDTDGFVNYGLSIKGVDLTAFFIERRDENLIKISFRSSGNFDVNLLARKYFEGGGHINAAGGKSHLSLQDTIKRFTEIVENHKNEFYV